MQAEARSSGWQGVDGEEPIVRSLRLALVWSLVLHLMVLAVVAWGRWPRHSEQPLASIEVSLATLPPPVEKPVEPMKRVEPVKAPAIPVNEAKPAPPPQPTKAVAVPQPMAKVEARAPAKPAQDAMRDLMKGIELPPDAPKLGDFAPAEKVRKASDPAAPGGQKFKLPDVPVAPESKDALKKPAEVKLRSSLAEETSRELEEELSKLKKVELPKEAKTPVTEAPSKAVPVREAKAPSVKSVEATLKIAQATPGTNAYLAAVKRKIVEQWNPPPVEVAVQVVVKFRLHRNGAVSGVAVEQSSGNDYYDLAAKRAVLSAEPLPGFPAELTDANFDTHFTFMVGERSG